jgi:MinD-like ATPase involved in chromosome partitioning or flagellar assembly
MNQPTSASPVAVVVGGFDEMAQALRASGRFVEVVSVSSTSSLRDSMEHIGELAQRANLAFVFSDNLPVDTRQTLDFLIGKLLGGGHRVAVMAVSGEAQRLVGQMPSLGMIKAPFSVNKLLGALSGMAGMGLLEPVDGGHAEMAPGTGVVPPIGGGPELDAFSPPAPAAAPAASGAWADPDAFSPPAPVATGTSSWADTGTFSPPAAPAEQPSQPAADVFAPPASGGFAPPIESGFAPPASGGFAPPASGGFAPPVESGFAPPASGGFDTQGGFPEPEPTGAFAPPAPPQDFVPPVAGQFAPPVGSYPSEPERPASAHPGWGGPADLMTPPARDDGGWDTPATSDFDDAGGWSPTQPGQPAWGEYPNHDAAPGVNAAAPGQGFASPWGEAQPVARDGYGDGSFGDPYGQPYGGGMPSSPLERGGMAPAGAPSQRRGMVIAVTSPKGGTGKSSLSLNLGSYLGLALRASGRTVCVVDANFQQADTGKYLGNYEPNIVDLSREAGVLDPQTIGRYLFQRRDYGITALLGPATPLEGIPQQINGRLYRRIIGSLREMFDYIIVDTPVAELYHDIFDNFVLKEADFMIVAVAPNVTTLLNADMYLRTIHADSHAGGRDFPVEKIGILLNRAEEGVDCSEDEVRHELGLWRFLGSVPESRDWKRANNNYELVAPKNYADLNQSFCKILYEVTGDPVLAEVMSDPSFGGGPKAKRSLLDRVLGRG